jgi:predicted transcriptional regulator
LELSEIILKAGELYKTGISCADVGKILNLPKATISSYVKKCGIPLDKGPRIAAKMKGKVGGRKGKTHTEAAKLLMSKAKKGKQPTLGTKRTPEQKVYMSLMWTLKKPFMNLLTEEEKKIRERTRSACKRFIARALKAQGGIKTTNTYELLGYTAAELKLHIEGTFKEGMTWEDRDSFHIDHIKPVAAFFEEGIYDPRIINALCNLQALTPDENRKKGSIFNYRVVRPSRKIKES